MPSLLAFCQDLKAFPAFILLSQLSFMLALVSSVWGFLLLAPVKSLLSSRAAIFTVFIACDVCYLFFFYCICSAIEYPDFRSKGKVEIFEINVPV